MDRGVDLLNYELFVTYLYSLVPYFTNFFHWLIADILENKEKLL